MKTETRTLYRFHELSPESQQRAIEHHLEHDACNLYYDDAQFEHEYLVDLVNADDFRDVLKHRGDYDDLVTALGRGEIVSIVIESLDTCHNTATIKLGYDSDKILPSLIDRIMPTSPAKKWAHKMFEYGELSESAYESIDYTNYKLETKLDDLGRTRWIPANRATKLAQLLSAQFEYYLDCLRSEIESFCLKHTRDYEDDYFTEDTTRERLNNDDFNEYLEDGTQV